MEQKKKYLKYSQEQYDRLMKEGVEAWNKWRIENPDKDILLDGAILNGSNLKGIYLNSGYFQDDNGNHNFRGKVYLRNAMLEGTHMEKAELSYAHLEDAGLHGAYLQGAKLERAYIEGADLLDAHIEGAKLFKAHIEGAWLCNAHLENVDLRFAHMKDADLSDAHFEGADLSFAHLQGTDLTCANLNSASFRWAIVDGSTLIKDCEIDSNTDFRGVGLGNARIDEERKLLLQYNMRHRNWKEWYKSHCLWRWPISLFWYISDYGRSAPRIAGVFFLLAFLFAVIYANFPGIVSGLNVKPHEPLWHYGLLLIIRPVYFSIVTMTTLGFGDMYANVQSILGHVLLTVQVLLGYVLLGAIVSRFAVLFTSGGVEIEFRETKKEIH